MKPFKNIIRVITTNWKWLIENRIIRIISYFSFVVLIIHILFLLIYWNRLPPQLPLWFSRPWGLDRLASLFWLIMLPATSLVWLFVSSFISCIYLREHLVFRQLVMFFSLLTVCFSCITTIKIILLVL